MLSLISLKLPFEKINSFMPTGQFFAIVLLSLFFALIAVSNPVHAQAWRAGKIIDDYTFANTSTMSSAQIQTFLNSKVSSCDTNGQQNSEFGGPDLNKDGRVQRWEWGKANYNQTTFPCLKDYTQGGKKASQIIYDVAQKYQINPQVLIVLLQKEQGLITDTWPLNIQYRSATGYGCPDTAPCDSQYYGLTNQLDWAAKMFRAILNASPSWYTPYVLGNNTIRFNPDASCGSSVVNIENRATQALYNYTPYQPNSATIAAPMGATVSCGAYGNINFLRYFNAWFGVTYNLGYATTWTGQSSHPTLNPGQSFTGFVTYRNSGSVAWYDNNSNPVRIATDEPINRASDFALNDTWGGDKNRLSLLFDTVYDKDGNEYSSNPHVVKPGESVKFSYTITVPENYPAGTYKEFFKPIAEGSKSTILTSPSKAWINITVNTARKSQYVSQSSNLTLRGGEQKSSYIDFKNTSNFTWYDNITAGKNGGTPVRLASVNSSANTNQSSQLGDSAWGTDRNRPSGVFSAVFNKSGQQYASNPHAVAPGETARFSFTMTAPGNASPASVRTYFAPVIDGGAGIIPVTNSLGSPISVWTDTSIIAGSALRPQQDSINLTINPRTQSSINYQFKNTGSTTLSQANTTLNIVSGSASALKDTSWPSDSIIGRLNQTQVAPGEIATFTAIFNAPSTKSSSTFSVSPYVSDSQIGLGDIKTSISTPNPIYSATYAGQSSYPTINQGSSTRSVLLYRNSGNTPWYDVTSVPSGAQPTVLATTNAINRKSVFSAGFATNNRASIEFSAVYKADGSPASNQHIVQPGEIAEFTFNLAASQRVKPGVYREFFQPIVEGGNPWNMGGVAWTNVTVKKATFSASWVKQSNYPTVTKGASAQVDFYYKNTGTAVWYDATAVPQGLNPITFATVNPINRSSMFLPSNRPNVVFSAVYEADGTTLAVDQHTALPGQVVQFSFTLNAPASLQPSIYREHFQPILEGGSTWNIGTLSWTDITVN